MKKSNTTETKSTVIKQPITTRGVEIEAPPENTCTQEEFDHLKDKGFDITNASQSHLSFSKRCEHNTVVNVRWESGKWCCAVFRSWDTKNKDYDASFSPQYKTLDELLDNVSKDFSARAKIVQSLKR